MLFVLNICTYLKISKPVQNNKSNDEIATWVDNNAEVILNSVNKYVVKQQEEMQKKQQEQATENIKKFEKELVNTKYAGVLNPQGQKVIVEFFDYNCGYCKVAAKNVKTLLEKRKDINPDECFDFISKRGIKYLTFEEKRIVGKNIYSFLKKHGGIWITCDVTPKKFIQSQDSALPDFNKNLDKVTSRNSLTDRFENEEHIKQFFGEVGLELVEIHPFSEVKDELYSINTHNIFDENIDKSLEYGIVAIFKVKENI